MLDTVAFVLDKVVPGLNHGLWLSVALIIPSALLGLGLGILAGTFRVYGPPWLKRLTDMYVSVFRGTPLVVQLYFWYFALPYLEIAGIRIILDPVEAAILGFALCSAAYHSEYIRGALLSIRHGQIKAAQALGLSPFKTVAHVILPQAVRRALPGCGNEIIYLVKYSSLASIITVNELTGMGRTIAKQTWQNIEVFTVVGLYYLALVTAATFALSWIENRTALPGFGPRTE